MITYVPLESVKKTTTLWDSMTDKGKEAKTEEK